jgi:hypothetical protein
MVLLSFTSSHNYKDLGFADIYLQESFKYQEEFQYLVDQLIKEGSLNLDNEFGDFTIKENKETLKEYIKFISTIEYPQWKISTIHISEDKSKKLWFAYYQVENAARKNDMQIIICKSNYKIIFFSLQR